MEINGQKQNTEIKEAVALVKVRPKWRVEKKRIPPRKGRWHNEKKKNS